jgi:hypothetical protein
MDKALENNIEKVQIVHPDLINYGNEYYQRDQSTHQTILQLESDSQRFYKWGDENDLPDKINKASYSDPMPAMIDTLVSIDLGIGYGFFKKIKDAKGEIVEQELLIDELPQEMRDFFVNNNIDEFLEGRAKNLRVFANSFTSLFFGRGTQSDKIVYLKNENTQDCRLGFKKLKPNNDEIISLISEYIYLCGDYSRGAYEYVTSLKNDNKRNEVLVVLSAENSVLKFKNQSRIIRHTKDYQSGQDYYSVPKWYESASAWLELASNIPIFQNALLKNGIFPGYEIEIPAEIIAEKKAIDNEKTEKDIKQEIVNGISETLKGSSKAGVTITHVSYLNGGVERKIKVTPIEIKASDKLFLESYDVCTRAISRASNVHPVLAGIALSSSLGSGSEIKYLYNWAVQKERAARRRLLSDLDFIKKINGWPQDIYFGIKNAKMLDTAIEKTGVGSVNPNQ